MDPLSFLPHGFPFRLLDRILMQDPGRWVAGTKRIAHFDPLLDEDGQLPPVLLAEVMAQVAGLAVSGMGAESAEIGILTRIDRFRCRPPIMAGDDLLVVARVVRRFGGSVRVRAMVRVDGRRRAAGELMLFFLPTRQSAP